MRILKCWQTDNFSLLGLQLVQQVLLWLSQSLLQFLDPLLEHTELGGPLLLLRVDLINLSLELASLGGLRLSVSLLDVNVQLSGFGL
jgi:hypothetical protein